MITPRRVALDTNVVLYAMGGPSPFRDACSQLLQLVRDGELRAGASIELVQEVLHVRSRRTGDRAAATAVARDLMDLLVIHPVERVDLLRALELYPLAPGLDALDAVHAASALRHGAEAFVSADTAFDLVPGLRRIDPRDLAARLPGGS